MPPLCLKLARCRGSSLERVTFVVRNVAYSTTLNPHDFQEGLMGKDDEMVVIRGLPRAVPEEIRGRVDV